MPQIDPGQAAFVVTFRFDKNVGEDSDQSRLNETIGYVVFQ